MDRIIITMPSKVEKKNSVEYYCTEDYISHFVDVPCRGIVNNDLGGVEHRISMDYVLDLSERMVESIGNDLESYYKELNKDAWRVCLYESVFHSICNVADKYEKLEGIYDKNVIVQGRGMITSLGDCSWAFDAAIKRNSYMWTYIARSMGIQCELTDLLEDFSKYLGDYLFSTIKRSALKMIMLRAIYRKIKYPGTSISSEYKRLRNPVEYYRRQESFKSMEDADIILVRTKMTSSLEQKLVEASEKKVCANAFDKLCKEEEVMLKYHRNMRFRRKLFNSFKPKTEFESLAYDVVLQMLPVEYVEAAGELLNIAKKIIAGLNVKKIYYSSITPGINFYCMALLKQYIGTEICAIQHSAAYSRRITTTYAERNSSDYFISWGWTDSICKLRAKLLPVAISRCVETEGKKPIAGKKKVLYAINVEEIADIGQGIVIGTKYIDTVIEFLGKLDDELRNRIVIRYEEGDIVNRKIIDICKRKWPTIGAEKRTDKSIADSITESAFIISDYYGSSHIEAFVLGRLSLMFEARKYKEKENDYFKEHISGLRKANLYFESGNELATMLNEIDNVDEWLYTEEHWDIFKEYFEAFTNYDNLENAWIKEITRR